MNEKLIEKKLRESVGKLGGLAIKFFAPTFTGLPDRIILLPPGKIWFVELKSSGKKRTPRQKFVHDLLIKLGFKVFTIDTQELLTSFLNTIRNEI